MLGEMAKVDRGSWRGCVGAEQGARRGASQTLRLLLDRGIVAVDRARLVGSSQGRNGWMAPYFG